MIENKAAVVLMLFASVITAFFTFGITHVVLSSDAEQRYQEGIEFGYENMCANMLPNEERAAEGSCCYRREKDGTLVPVNALIVPKETP